MPHVRRSLACCALVLAPALALAQADGRVRYALGGGAQVVSGTTSLASANLGAEGVSASPDRRWRLAAKALWARSAGETTSRQATLLLVQESQHRWNDRTWVRQQVSVYPALRTGEKLRSSLDTGVAVAVTSRARLHVGLTHRYDGAARGIDTRFVTGVSLKLD